MIVTLGQMHNVGIAQAHVARAPDCVRTVLGSCVGVMLYDPVLRVGGLIHALLPGHEGFEGAATKFADSGIDALLRMVLQAGAAKGRLIAKLAGGAAMFGKDSTGAIGIRNIEAARGRLKAHHIRLAGEDVGGARGRKVSFDCENGLVTIECIGEPTRTI